VNRGESAGDERNQPKAQLQRPPDYNGRENNRTAHARARILVRILRKAFELLIG
jgi:hypothetical protein